MATTKLTAQDKLDAVAYIAASLSRIDASYDTFGTVIENFKFEGFSPAATVAMIRKYAAAASVDPKDDLYTFACLILARGTSMIMNSKAMRRTRATGQDTASRLLQRYHVVKYDSPGEEVVTLGRIACIVPVHMAGLIASNVAQGGVVGPKDLPTYFRFPTAASIIPPGHRKSFVMFLMMFDDRIHQRDQKNTPVNQLIEFFEVQYHSEAICAMKDRATLNESLAQRATTKGVNIAANPLGEEAAGLLEKRIPAGFA